MNLGEKEKLGIKELRPIQMTFSTPKFMLPIRLGMANALGTQDMVIYAFSKKGRVEVSNYRTLKVPTNNNIPEFIRDTFGAFYRSVFDQTWKGNKNAIFLEYAWNLSGNNFVKCDPCSTNPPTYADLKDAGVHWVTYGNEQGRWGGGADYHGDLYFTRLHVRYDRANFPQDLDFQETPNQENFQARYVMHIANHEEMNCEEGERYKKTVRYRREEEIKELEKLTGWSSVNFYSYVRDWNKKMEKSNTIEDDVYGQPTTPSKKKIRRETKPKAKK